MTENNITEVKDSTSSRGAQWAGAGSLIALAAQSLTGGGLFGGGGIFGGGYNNQAQQMANAAVQAELARKDSEIALLKAGQETDKKLVEVYANLRVQDKEQDAKIAGLKDEIHALDKKFGEAALVASNGITMLTGSVATLQHAMNNITKVVVPNTAICPGWGQVTVTPTAPSYIPTPAAA